MCSSMMLRVRRQRGNIHAKRKIQSIERDDMAWIRILAAKVQLESARECCADC